VCGLCPLVSSDLLRLTKLILTSEGLGRGQASVSVSTSPLVAALERQLTYFADLETTGQDPASFPAMCRCMPRV
jgi:hypothetical protein